MTCELLNGAIFLHIPKTGGTWVYELLLKLKLVRRPVGRHPHAEFIRAVIYPNNKARWREWTKLDCLRLGNLISPGREMLLPFTFCFVRHPIRWYASWWRYVRNTGGAKPVGKRLTHIKCWSPLTSLAVCWDRNFSTFVRNMHERVPGFVSGLYNMYAPPEINFVGKQEQLAEDLLEVFKMLSIDVDEEAIRNRPRINESKSELDARWDPGLLAEVQAAELAGIKRFGYEVLDAK